MTTDLDRTERSQLCDLFDQLGPSAPTLCGEWTTQDLAAHLAVRERDPRSGPGILFGGPFEGYTKKLMDKELRRGYSTVVERVRHPAPGLLSIAPIRVALSLVEYTVHHEDVRRANGQQARTDVADLQREIWAKTRQLGSLMVRKAKISPISLHLVATGDVEDATDLGKGDRRVTITGEPLEILLFLYGRADHCDVTLDGADEDVARVRAASFGI